MKGGDQRWLRVVLIGCALAVAAAAIYVAFVLVRPVPDLDRMEEAASGLRLPTPFERVDTLRTDYGRCWDPIDCPQSNVRITWAADAAGRDCEALATAARQAAGTSVAVGDESSGCELEYSVDGVTVTAFYGERCEEGPPTCVYVFASDD